MFRKKALALLTAAVMIIGNAAVFPSIAVSAADKGSSQTTTKTTKTTKTKEAETSETPETPPLALDVPVKGSNNEVVFTAEQLSNAKVKYFTVKYYPKKVDWVAVIVYRIPGGSGSYEDAFVWKPVSSGPYTAIVSLKDITAKVGKLEDGDLLKFGGSGSDVKSFTVTPHSRRPDVELNTGSVASGILKEAEDWTPEGGIPNGKTDLTIGDKILLYPDGNISFNDYKSLEFNYTVDDPSQIEYVRVILHGYADDSVGWKTLDYKAKSSGTIKIDCKQFKDKTVQGIYVCAMAPKTAKIGDEFTPGLTVTSARLISIDPPASSSASGGSSAAPSNIKASKTADSITLTWDSASGADMYRVYMYNDKTEKYEKYKDVKSAKCTVSGLKAGTKYKFKVTAYSKNKDGKYVQGESSKAVSITTKS